MQLGLDFNLVEALVAGVDEVGRGPLCGAVVTAAVILDPARPIIGLNDSKKLSEARREALFDEIREKAQAFCIARAEVEEIDRLYGALLDGGAALMPIGEYGFSQRFGWVNDRFGVSWQIARA